MAMALSSCLQSQTHKLSPFHNTLTVNPRPLLRNPNNLTSIRRAVSFPAVQITPSSSSVQEERKKAVVRDKWRAAIDFKWIKENKDLMEENIKNRKSNANLELLIEIYDRFLSLQREAELLRGERNTVANKMKGKLEPSVRQMLVEEGKNLKEQLAALEENLVQLMDMLQLEGQCIPNITHPDVPIGGEDSSELRKMVGSQRKFSFPIKDHLQLGKQLDLFDFDAAAEG